MNQDMEQYQELFIQESKDRLVELEQLILDLEKDPQNISIIKAMFRTAHTFKGMAATMGYNDMAHMTHLMENLMSIVEKGGHTADEVMISLLFDCRDTLANVLTMLEENNSDGFDYQEIFELLEKKIKSFSGKKKSIKKEIHSPNNEKEKNLEIPSKNAVHKKKLTNDEIFANLKEETEFTNSDLKSIAQKLSEKKALYLVRINLHQNTEMKYARAYLCIKKVRDFGEIFKIIPDEEIIKEEAFSTEFKILVFIEDSKKLKYLMQDIESVAAVDTVEIIKLKNSLKEKKSNQKLHSKSRNATEKDFSVQNIKISTKHLDNLMNLTGELLITKIRLDKIAQSTKIDGLSEALNLINRITFDLQDEVLQMRMIPVAHIFDRFPRMMRDLGKKLGKMVDFSMEGRDIELDRTIIDQIGDPLVHLLRNAIDHGIETPNERISKGKPRIASIRLLAYRDKNFVVIEVSDDGFGIDFMQIKNKAMKKGMISAEDAEKMTEYDLKNLLLGGGISTAKEISEVSGRGVGLGVVKQKIENIGGIIEVDSTIKKGTTFRLKLPLTVAIIKSLLVSLGAESRSEIYAIPITNVVRTLVINEKEIQTIKKKEVITILGKIVSLVRLRKLVQFKNNSATDEVLEKQPMKTIIVIERSGMEVGLLVDNLIGQQEIVIKNLGGLLKNVKGISGGAILGDGNVALIVDVSSLF